MAAGYGGYPPVQATYATVQLPGPYAGFWLRFVAYLIDGFLLTLVSMALFIPLFLMMGGMAMLQEMGRRGADPDVNPFGIMGPAMFTMIFAIGAIALIIGWLYFAYSESGPAQATIGKRAIGLYVTDMRGQRITFARASGRYFAKLITGMIPLAIGYIMAGFTAQKQALHDIIASCLVLRK